MNFGGFPGILNISVNGTTVLAVVHNMVAAIIGIETIGTVNVTVTVSVTEVELISEGKLPSL